MQETVSVSPNGGAHVEARLACLHLPGCVSCAAVLPIAELLESRSVAVEYIDVAEGLPAMIDELTAEIEEIFENARRDKGESERSA